MQSIHRQDDITVRDAGGRVLLRDVVSFVIYSRTKNEELRDIAVGVVRSILSHFAENRSLDYVDYEGNQQILDAFSLEEVFSQRFKGPLRAPNANLVVLSQELGVPEFYLWYNGKSLEDKIDPEASYIWFWVPIGWFLARKQALLREFDSIAKLLPISCAYSSRAIAGARNMQKQALARRFQTLDIADPLCVSADIAEEVPGAYWLNIYPPALSARLGGLTSVAAALPHAFSVDETASGSLRVQLATDPELGDANRQAILQPYRELALLLERCGVLHIPRRVVYFFDENGLADREAMLAWHRRHS